MQKETIKLIIGGFAVSAVTSLLTLAGVKATAGTSFSVMEVPQARTAVQTDAGRAYTVSAPTAANLDFTRAAESTVNSVVSIKNYAVPRYGNGSGSMNPFFNDPFFEFFFGPQQNPGRGGRQGGNADNTPVQQGLGSGVIISEDGYIVTNNHVIDGADKLEVTLNDNRTFEAKLIGADPVTDLALVKIETTGLPAIRLGDSDALKVGEWVLAVGNPFGFTSTVTSGIVSAKARSISSATSNRGSGRRGGQMGLESYIQTDAAVNPGNSGGALVNLNGELVGINTAIYSNTGSYSGYSFAVPVSLVRKVVEDLRTYGTVQRAVMGVSIITLDSELARDHHITDHTEGVLVMGFADRSSAREAGMEEGDLIISFDGTPIKSVAQLQELVNRHAPGDKVKIGYVRDNKERSTTITLLNNQGNTELTVRGEISDLGCTFEALSPEEARSLGLNGGVKVKEVKRGKFRSADIKDGFIILKINGQSVSSVDDVEQMYQLINSGQAGERVMFISGLYPSGSNAYYAVPLE